VGLANPLHIILLLIVLAAWIVPAYLVARLAAQRGRSFGGYLAGGLIFGWLFSLIAAVVISSRPAQR
jgi:hypothetical protein